MNNLHYNIFGTRTAQEDGTIVTKYLAVVSSPSALEGLDSWVEEDSTIGQGHRQVEKALEGLAQEAARYIVKHYTEGIPEGSIDGDGKPINWRELYFVTAFSFTSPLPYERGFDSQGNIITPFHLNQHWQDYFCGKYREAYLSLRTRTKEPLSDLTSGVVPIEDNSGAVLDEETEVFPDGSEVRTEDERMPIGGK